MTKPARLKAVNVLLALLMAAQALSGILHEHMSPEAFAHIHTLCGLLLLVLAVLHLVMNWGWVRTNLFR